MGKTKKGPFNSTKKKQGAYIKVASVMEAKRDDKLKKKVKKSKAVERHLKKMSFNNSKAKGFELLDSDITNVLMAPAKAKPSPTKVKN